MIHCTYYVLTHSLTRSFFIHLRAYIALFVLYNMYRQCKLLEEGKPSSMTWKRLAALEQIGFPVTTRAGKHTATEQGAEGVLRGFTRGVRRDTI